tara:strand:+ start:746 stop:937 length:192 start_codon:yes stop_codon:yes gene_type:complete
MYLEALKLRYESEIMVATTNLKNYVDNSVGVAEHPDIVGSMDAMISAIAEAKEKLDVVEELMP